MQHRSKNKTAWVLPMLLGLITGWSACSDEDHLADDALAVTFVSTHATSGSGVTRVNEKDEWTGNETFGICMVQPTETLPKNSTFNTYVPVKPITDPTKSITLKPDPVNQTLYFPNDGTKRKFIAYGPVRSDVTDNKVSYNLNDQSTLPNMEQADFIYNINNEGYGKGDATVPMKFTHGLSRIVIYLTKDEKTTDPADFISQNNLKLKNMHTSVTMNLSDGSRNDRTGNGDITPYRSLPVTPIDGNTQTITCQAIVATGETNSTGYIDFGGVTNYKLNDLTFKAGKSYEFKFVMKGKSVELEASNIIPWDGGTVVWNGQYYLHIAEKELVHYKNESIGNTVAIHSTYDKGITTTSNNDWITVNRDVEMVSEPNNEYVLTYDIDENPETSERSGTITIAAGPLRIEVPVKQSAEEAPVEGEIANCYILQPGGETVTIHVERTIEEFRKYFTTYPKVSDDCTAVIVWSDVAKNSAPTSGTIQENALIAEDSAIKALSYDKGSKSFSVSSGNKTGNVVIALYSPVNNRVLWSWHIWVTDYDPEQRSTKYNSSVIMHQTLGQRSATTGGLYYQWGRKDPLPGTTEEVWNITSYSQRTYQYAVPETHETIDHGMPLNTVVENPEKFIKCHRSGDTWVDNDMLGGKRLWDTTNTLMNPCPANWRVWDENEAKYTLIDYSTFQDWVGLSYRYDQSLCLNGGGVIESNGTLLGLGESMFDLEKAGAEHMNTNRMLIWLNLRDAYNKPVESRIKQIESVAPGFGAQVRCKKQ